VYVGASLGDSLSEPHGVAIVAALSVVAFRFLASRCMHSRRAARLFRGMTTSTDVCESESGYVYTRFVGSVQRVRALVRASLALALSHAHLVRNSRSLTYTKRRRKRY